MAKRKYTEEEELGLQTEEEAPKEKVAEEEIPSAPVKKVKVSIEKRYEELLKDKSVKEAIRILYKEYGIKETEPFAKQKLK